MAESAARTSSSLAITERKANTHRPGGCVGIFFQLFDWNRRFYKKKFFPKKLLPPARTKVSKKFNADEKLPVGRHLLIADENSGGFPGNSKKKKNGDHRLSLDQKKHEMKAPGLVARLMGLDAMPIPAAQQDNKSDRSSPKSDSKVEGGRSSGKIDRLILSPDKGNVRPQKLQKTGILEKRPVTRLGSEALQIKNVWLRARKHHHPKLASPIKSPRMGRNASRLLDAAARILEPGLQATSRARCSLSYSNSMIESCRENVMIDARMDADLQSECHHIPGVAQVNTPQPSCRSCGNLLGRMAVRAAMDEDSTMYDLPGSDFRGAFFHGVEESRSRPAAYLENETDVVLLKPRYPSERVTVRVEESRPVRSEVIGNGMHNSQRHDQIPPCQMFTSQKNSSSSTVLRDRTQRRTQMQFGDRVPPRSKLGNIQGRRLSSSRSGVSETKDFISLNRNVNKSRVTVASKPDRSYNSSEVERRFCTGKNDSPPTQRSPVRKRRTLNVNGQASNAGSSSSLLEKQRINRENVVTGNKLSSSTANSVNRTYLKTKPTNHRVGKDTDVVSFTFSSPVRSGARGRSQSEMDVKRRDQINSTIDEKSQQKSKMECGIKIPPNNSSRINGDALGALLEQKLKELTHQVENEAASGFVPSARTTATILQELISALTAEKPSSYDDPTQGHDTNESQSGSDSMDGVAKADSRIKRSSVGASCGVDNFSPGCVLDASFSNESCVSSSMDDSPGHRPQSEHVSDAHMTDADLSDSASSSNQPRYYNPIVTDLLKDTASVLENVNMLCARLTGAKLEYMHEVVLYTELIFGNTGLHNSPRFIDFLLGPFLDELENLVKAAWKNSIILGFGVGKEENPLRRFLIDCLIECLNVRYNRYSNCGYRVWSRLPKGMNADILIQVFDEEVRKWISVAGKAPDEIIEMEMSTSLGKWTDFEIEGFETGAQVSHDIVQSLVNEMVIDFCVC